MKRCTYCGRRHPDEAAVCSLDQHPLELVSSLSDTPLAPSNSQPSTSWPLQVVIPAIVWLIVNFLLVGLFSVGASYLLGILTALWAAVDCSKLQPRGPRVLSIPFKPVVVFAVVAFLLCGFGFVWYLVMRHRVKTAPIDVEMESEKIAA